MSAGISAVAAIAIGVSAVGTFMSMKAAEEQADAQKAASAAQGRMASVEAQRERVKQAREARLRRGQVMAAGVNSGMGGGTSGLSGAVSSITSQASSNIGTINQMQTFAQEASAANQRGADAQASMMQWQAVGNIGKTIFSNRAAISDMTK